MKLKIVVYGAADFIVEATRNIIRPENCEIIAFADRCMQKQEVLYEGLPVLNPLELKFIEFDYIVVGAWASYGSIRSNLLEMGIPGNKVLPLLSMEKIKAVLGMKHDIPVDVIKTLFQDDATSLMEKVDEYLEIERRYEKMPSFGAWNDVIMPSTGLIAHAGGGWAGKNKIMYTNSEEAFVTSLEAGFQVFEFDVWGECEGDLVFGHDGNRYSSFSNKGYTYTPCTFSKMVSIVGDRTDLRLILDIKWSNIEEYVSILKKIEKLSAEMQWYKQAHNQLIIETYDRDTSLYALKNGWHGWLTSYRNPDGDWYKKSVSICGEAEIKTMMLPAELILGEKKYLNIMSDKGIGVVAYSTDNIDDYCQLKTLGVKGILTNYLRP